MRPASVVLAVCAALAGAPLVAAEAGQGTASGSALVVSIPGDKRFHQPGCPLVRKAGSKVQVMKQSEAGRRGLEAHDCGDPATVERDTTAAANATPVYVQAGDKQYHKAGCARVKPGATESTVERAAKDHWPCPVCKPPIRQRAK
jgi:hypothetical protein